MWKRLLALIAGAYGTIAVGLETPILPISVNFELSETQYELRLRALNTPVVRAYLFNGTNAFDATGYDAYLAWGKNTSATNMVYVEGVTSTNGYVDFTIASNNLAYPIERWYSAVMLTYPADGKVHSVGSGYMTVLPAPEVSSTAILLKTYAINGSEYGPFTGSFSNWPFLLKDEYEGGFVEVGTYVAATSALWTTIATLATTNWVTNQGYVTASITNGFATTNWVTNQAYGAASDISDLQDATNANRVLIGTVGTNLALQSNSQAAAVGLVSTNLGLASNALTLAIGIVETDLVTASNYFDTFMGTSGSNYDAAIGLVATNLDTASNALSAAVGLVGTNLNTASNALRTAIGLVSTNLETATNQLIEATNTIFGLQSTVSVVYAWGDHADAGYLSAGTNIFDRVYAATRSALDTNIVNGSAIYTGVVSSVAYTNVVELTLGKTYAWGFTKVNANGTSTLSIGTAQLTATLAGLATNHFVCDFTDTNLVLTLSGTGDSKSNVSNMYVCAVTQGTVSAAGDLHVGGSMYLDGALYTNPAFALAELRLATNALNVRAGTLDGATNALNGRMTALDAASTGAVPVLTGRVTALDAASTGRVAVLEAATNALDGRMLALDAASTGLVAVLESATGTLNVAVSALQGQTGTWNATATYTQRVADVEAYTSRVAALESATGALNTAVGTITGQVGALQGATNALDGRMLALDAASTGAVAVLNSATNALNGRMTALDAASTGAVPVLAGRVTALDAASTGRVAVLEAATGALNTAVGSLQAATNALDVRVGVVESLPSATNWSAYPVAQNVDFAGYTISNVTEISSAENLVVLDEPFTNDVFEAGTWTNVSGMAWEWSSAWHEGYIYATGDGTASNVDVLATIGRTYAITVEGLWGTNGINSNIVQVTYGGVALPLVADAKYGTQLVSTQLTAISAGGLLIESLDTIDHTIIVVRLTITDITPSNDVAIARVASDRITLGGETRTNWPATNDFAALAAATNALDIRVDALEGGAGGTYPVFLLPVGALEGSWTDFEIKASTNNFTSDALYWWKSWTSQPIQNDSDAIALFTDPYAGADPRTLYRRTTDVSIATHLASEDSTVEVVIFQPSHNIEGGGTWMTPGNTNLVWAWIRVDEGGYEMTPDGSNYWFHPILPEQWMAAPLGQWEWAEIHTAKLAAAYAETYVTWRTNTFDGTNGVYFVNPHNGSNYWILTP